MVMRVCDRWDKSVIAWVIAAFGGNPAYPGFSAVEPKMVPWVFYFDTVLGCLTEPYIMFIISY